MNPDYVELNTGSSMALLASLITLAIAAAGVLLLCREWLYWWETWLSERSWAWIAMACITSVVPIVMVTQRPRPSYMFVLGITLRAAVGMCTFVALSRFEVFKRAAPAIAIVIVLLIAVAPPYYYRVNSGQPLLKFYRRLAPYQGVLEQENAGLVVMGWPDELCNYLGKSRGCRSFPFRTLRDEVSPNMLWDKVLDKYRATLFFADEGVMTDMLGPQFVLNAPSYGWKVMAMHRQTNDDWAVLKRIATTTSASGPVNAEPVMEIVEQTSRITLGKGWYDFEHYAGEDVRWVNNDAELEVRRAGPISLTLMVEGGPGLGGQPADIEFYSSNKLVQTAPLLGRRTIQVDLQNGEAHLRLHVNSPNRLVPGDPRILNFRVFKISVSAPA